MIPKKIIQKCRRIKVVITDVDGVLTDGGMYFSEKGHWNIPDRLSKMKNKGKEKEKVRIMCPTS